MADYVISTCSTADMPEEFYKARDIRYACFTCNMEDMSFADDLGKSMSNKEFYQRIKDGAMPTTSQVNQDEYMEFFEPTLKEGKDVIHLALSSGISGTYNSANLAAQELREMYPDRKVYIIDSLCASAGQGLLATMMADKRDEGMSADDLFEYAEQIKLTINHWFFSTDLTSFFRGGRISKTAYAFGTMLNICPLMNVDVEGKLVIREKVRTKKKVMQAMVAMMDKHVKNGPDYDGLCYISESACMDDAQIVKDMIESKYSNLKGKVQIFEIGAVIGSHTGIGTVALFFEGDKRVD